MTLKYNYDNYTITTTFRNDFNLSITASDNFSSDYFINENVELTKIKKDTIIATLSRKSQNQLKCQFNLVDVEPKKLIVSIIVSYDFLPTFTEFIQLEQIQNKKVLNKVETVQLKSEINDLQRLISSNAFNSKNICSQGSHSFASKTLIYNKQLIRGSYLFEISGYFTCPNGGGIQKHDLVFTFELDKINSDEVPYCSYTNSSYGYPFSLRKEIIIENDSILYVFVENKQGSSSNFTNTIASVTPILKLK